MAVVNPPTFDNVYATSEAAICNKALSRIGAEVIRDTDEDTKQSRICKAVYAQTRDELLRLYPFNFSQRTRYIPLDAGYIAPLGLYSYAFKAWDYRDLTAKTTTGSPVLNITEDVYAPDIGLAVYGAGIPENARIIAVDSVNHTITIDRNATVDAVGVSVKKYIPLLKVVHIGGNNNNLYELVGSEEKGRILTNISSGVVNNETVLEMRCVEQVINPNYFDSIFVDALVLRIAMKIAISFTQSSGLISLLYQEFAQILQVAKIASAEEKELEMPDEYYGSVPQSNVRRG